MDTIEQVIVRSGLAEHPVGPTGYAVGCTLAEEGTVGCATGSPSRRPNASWLSASRRRGAWRDGVFPLQDASEALALSDPAEVRLGRQVTLLRGRPNSSATFRPA
ncbi:MULTISPECIES: hypothetical protein [Streptomyces]|uniref:hypothetical protein n=1 Tax=Streptomyces TaxID=1883 RepID=UPI00374E165C